MSPRCLPTAILLPPPGVRALTLPALILFTPFALPAVLGAAAFDS
jgi:hypothetical protein